MCFNVYTIPHRSIIFFLISIMAFVWRTGTIEDTSHTLITSHDALAPRIIVTLVFSLGLVYLVLIRSTLQRYGTVMDRAWRTRVLIWIHQSFDYNNHPIAIDPRHSLRDFVPPSSHSPPMNSRNPSPPIPPAAVSEAFLFKDKPRGRSTSIKPISTFFQVENSHGHLPVSEKIKQTKILNLSADDPSVPSEEMLKSYQMTTDDWEQLSSVRIESSVYSGVLVFI